MDYERGNKGLIHGRQTLFLLNKFTPSISLLYLPFYIEENTLYGCYGYLTTSLAESSNNTPAQAPSFFATSPVPSCPLFAVWLCWQPAHLPLRAWQRQLRLEGAAPRLSATKPDENGFPYYCVVVTLLLLLSLTSRSNCQGFWERILCHKTRKLPRATGKQVWGSPCSEGLNRAEVAPVEFPGGTRSTLMRWQTHT